MVFDWIKLPRNWELKDKKKSSLIDNRYLLKHNWENYNINSFYKEIDFLCWEKSKLRNLGDAAFLF